MEIKYRDANQVKILELVGILNKVNIDGARQWLEMLTAKQPAQIVVNLGKVSYLDASGLSTLVQGLNRSREMNGNLRLCNLQSPVRMIFELTRLDRVFDIYVSEDDAIEAFLQGN